MPLKSEDQVNLLKDLLTSHQTDCCGSVSECEQIERLVKSLLFNTTIDHHVKTILNEIYDYSQNGINTTDLTQHIESNQQRLSVWVSDMNQLS